MNLAQLLFSQGFGSRRECTALARSGRVRIGGQALDDPAAPVEPHGLVFEVDGQPWPYREQALILMNKPAGHECSQRPSAWPAGLFMRISACSR